jgi:hypothetical protein
LKKFANVTPKTREISRLPTNHPHVRIFWIFGLSSLWRYSTEIPLATRPMSSNIIGRYRKVNIFENTKGNAANVPPTARINHTSLPPQKGPTYLWICILCTLSVAVKGAKSPAPRETESTMK